MIYKPLILLTRLLNDHLKNYFKLKNDIVYLSSVNDREKTLSSNRVNVTMVNIERETAGGIQMSRQHIGKNLSARIAPGWQINLYVLFSVLFQEKQYNESLRILSGVMSFIQKKNKYDEQDTDIPFAIEPVNLSFQELSNLWGILGGVYYPSILCKIRVLTIDEQEIIDLSGIIMGKEENVKADLQ
ncbi:MAG: DUF4255 domain-containing protein [Dysgonamonadaceae bacterium]|jgi:hypothetical protein|nr:DUF4255 domain-containing protein [Dysgonamonadaceae bacterium]